MSRLKYEDKDNPLVAWLIGQGFDTEGGPRGEEGYTKRYKIDVVYFVWVTIDLIHRKIHLYKEYDCGGRVDDGVIIIEPEWLESLGAFIDNIDKALEPWID